MNASRAVSENWVRLAATNASASEQIATMTASRPSSSAEISVLPATWPSHSRGTTTFSVAATAPPSTRNPPACRKSCSIDDRNTSSFGVPSAWRWAGGFSQFAPLPRARNSHPITTDTSSDATSRETATIGLPGNATAVDAITTGLIAGADSRNASAAAGVTPRLINAADTGTEAHSHPGSTAPDTLATGTASAGFFGSAFAKNDAGTNAVSAADSSTPSTRNGVAWMTTPTNMVAQVRTPSSVKIPLKMRRPNSASTTSSTNVPVNTIWEPLDS